MGLVSDLAFCWGKWYLFDMLLVSEMWKCVDEEQLVERQRPWGCEIWWGSHEIRVNRGGKSWAQPDLLGGETPTSCSRGSPPIRQVCLELPYAYLPFSTDILSLIRQQQLLLSVRYFSARRNPTIPKVPVPGRPEIARTAVVGGSASASVFQRNLNRQYQNFNALTIMASPLMTDSLNVGTMDLSSSHRASLSSVPSILSATLPREAG